MMLEWFFLNVVPLNARRVMSPSLGMIRSFLFAVVLLGLSSQVFAAGAWCTSPYIQVAGQGVGVAETGEFQIQSLSIGEPFTDCSTRTLTVVIKVNTLDPGNTGRVTPPVNTEWEAEFYVPHNLLTPDPGTDQVIFVSWDTETVPSGEFNYGFFDTNVTMIGPIQTGARYTSQCSPISSPCPATGTVTPDGTITINLDMTSPLSFKDVTGNLRFTMSALPPGWQLSQIAGNTWVCACAVGNGTPVNVSATFASQNYTIQGNGSCSSPPIAALVASPTSGAAPLTVNFDASGSVIPAGGCGTIRNYIFNFGDGTQITQSSPTTAHIYTGTATYPARVRVTNTVGLTSTNNAEVDITVSSEPPPPLSIVSRVTHAGAGDFDIALPQPPSARGIECRSTGGNYKMVFTFSNNLVGVASASLTTGTGGVASSAIGPNPNQYTVNLTGVANQQYITVILNNVIDSTGATGNVTGTMGVLIGDVNATGRVDAADVSMVRQQTLQPITNSSFREDVNASGRIDAADVSIVRQQTLTSLP